MDFEAHDRSVIETLEREVEEQQRTIDALVAALEECKGYAARYESEHMCNDALAAYEQARAALALARKEG